MQLRRALNELRQAALASPLGRHLRANLLIFPRRDKFCTAQDRKVARMLYKRRCGILRNLAAWDFHKLQGMSTITAYVAKSLFYNKCGLGGQDILFIS